MDVHNVSAEPIKDSVCVEQPIRSEKISDGEMKSEHIKQSDLEGDTFDEYDVIYQTAFEFARSHGYGFVEWEDDTPPSGDPASDVTQSRYKKMRDQQSRKPSRGGKTRPSLGTTDTPVPVHCFRSTRPKRWRWRCFNHRQSSLASTIQKQATTLTALETAREDIASMMNLMDNLDDLAATKENTPPSDPESTSLESYLKLLTEKYEKMMSDTEVDKKHDISEETKTGLYLPNVDFHTKNTKDRKQIYKWHNSLSATISREKAEQNEGDCLQKNQLNPRLQRYAMEIVTISNSGDNLPNVDQTEEPIPTTNTDSQTEKPIPTTNTDSSQPKCLCDTLCKLTFNIRKDDSPQETASHHVDMDNDNTASQCHLEVKKSAIRSCVSSNTTEKLKLSNTTEQLKLFRIPMCDRGDSNKTKENAGNVDDCIIKKAHRQVALSPEPATVHNVNPYHDTSHLLINALHSHSMPREIANVEIDTQEIRLNNITVITDSNENKSDLHSSHDCCDNSANDVNIYTSDVRSCMDVSTYVERLVTNSIRLNHGYLADTADIGSATQNSSSVKLPLNKEPSNEESGKYNDVSNNGETVMANTDLNTNINNNSNSDTECYVSDMSNNALPDVTYVTNKNRPNAECEKIVSNASTEKTKNRHSDDYSKTPKLPPISPNGHRRLSHASYEMKSCTSNESLDAKGQKNIKISKSVREKSNQRRFQQRNGFRKEQESIDALHCDRELQDDSLKMLGKRPPTGQQVQMKPAITTNCSKVRNSLPCLERLTNVKTSRSYVISKNNKRENARHDSMEFEKDAVTDKVDRLKIVHNENNREVEELSKSSNKCLYIPTPQRSIATPLFARKHKQKPGVREKIQIDNSSGLTNDLYLHDLDYDETTETYETGDAWINTNHFRNPSDQNENNDDNNNNSGNDEEENPVVHHLSDTLLSNERDDNVDAPDEDFVVCTHKLDHFERTSDVGVCDFENTSLKTNPKAVQNNNDDSETTNGNTLICTSALDVIKNKHRRSDDDVYDTCYNPETNANNDANRLCHQVSDQADHDLHVDQPDHDLHVDQPDHDLHVDTNTLASTSIYNPTTSTGILIYNTHNVEAPSVNSTFVNYQETCLRDVQSEEVKGQSEEVKENEHLNISGNGVPDKHVYLWSQNCDSRSAVKRHSASTGYSINGRETISNKRNVRCSNTRKIFESNRRQNVTNSWSNCTTIDTNSVGSKPGENPEKVDDMEVNTVNTSMLVNNPNSLTGQNVHVVEPINLHQRGCPYSPTTENYWETAQRESGTNTLKLADIGNLQGGTIDYLDLGSFGEQMEQGTDTNNRHEPMYVDIHKTLAHTCQQLGLLDQKLGMVDLHLQEFRQQTSRDINEKVGALKEFFDSQMKRNNSFQSGEPGHGSSAKLPTNDPNERNDIRLCASEEREQRDVSCFELDVSKCTKNGAKNRVLCPNMEFAEVVSTPSNRKQSGPSSTGTHCRSITSTSPKTKSGPIAAHEQHQKTQKDNSVNRHQIPSSEKNITNEEIRNGLLIPINQTNLPSSMFSKNHKPKPRPYRMAEHSRSCRRRNGLQCDKNKKCIMCLPVPKVPTAKPQSMKVAQLTTHKRATKTKTKVKSPRVVKRLSISNNSTTKRRKRGRTTAGDRLKQKSKKKGPVNKRKKKSTVKTKKTKTSKRKVVKNRSTKNRSTKPRTVAFCSANSAPMRRKNRIKGRKPLKLAQGSPIAKAIKSKSNSIQNHVSSRKKLMDSVTIHKQRLQKGKPEKSNSVQQMESNECFVTQCTCNCTDSFLDQVERQNLSFLENELFTVPENDNTTVTDDTYFMIPKSLMSSIMAAFCETNKRESTKNLSASQWEADLNNSLERIAYGKKSKSYNSNNTSKSHQTTSHCPSFNFENRRAANSFMVPKNSYKKASTCIPQMTAGQASRPIIKHDDQNTNDRFRPTEDKINNTQQVYIHDVSSSGSSCMETSLCENNHHQSCWRSGKEVCLSVDSQNGSRGNKAVVEPTMPLVKCDANRTTHMEISDSTTNHEIASTVNKKTRMEVSDSTTSHKITNAVSNPSVCETELKTVSQSTMEAKTASQSTMEATSADQSSVKVKPGATGNNVSGSHGVTECVNDLMLPEFIMPSGNDLTDLTNAKSLTSLVQEFCQKNTHYFLNDAESSHEDNSMTSRCDSSSSPGAKTSSTNDTIESFDQCLELLNALCDEDDAVTPHHLNRSEQRSVHVPSVHVPAQCVPVPCLNVAAGSVQTPEFFKALPMKNKEATKDSEDTNHTAKRHGDVNLANSGYTTSHPIPIVRTPGISTTWTVSCPNAAAENTPTNHHTPMDTESFTASCSETVSLNSNHNKAVTPEDYTRCFNSAGVLQCSFDLTPNCSCAEGQLGQMRGSQKSRNLQRSVSSNETTTIASLCGTDNRVTEPCLLVGNEPQRNKTNNESISHILKHNHQTTESKQVSKPAVKCQYYLRSSCRKKSTVAENNLPARDKNIVPSPPNNGKRYQSSRSIEPCTTSPLSRSHLRFTPRQSFPVLRSRASTCLAVSNWPHVGVKRKRSTTDFSRPESGQTNHDNGTTTQRRRRLRRRPQRPATTASRSSVEPAGNNTATHSCSRLRRRPQRPRPAGVGSGAPEQCHWLRSQSVNGVSQLPLPSENVAHNNSLIMGDENVMSGLGDLAISGANYQAAHIASPSDTSAFADDERSSSDLYLLNQVQHDEN